MGKAIHFFTSTGGGTERDGGGKLEKKKGNNSRKGGGVEMSQNLSWSVLILTGQSKLMVDGLFAGQKMEKKILGFALGGRQEVH